MLFLVDQLGLNMFNISDIIVMTSFALFSFEISLPVNIRATYLVNKFPQDSGNTNALS